MHEWEDTMMITQQKTEENSPMSREDLNVIGNLNYI